MSAPVQQPASDAAQHQAAQGGLVVVLGASLAALWPSLNLANLRGSLPRFKAGVAAVVIRHAQASATLAAQQYQAQRVAAGVGAGFRPTPAPPPSVQQIAQSVDWAVQPLWNSNVVAAATGQPEVAPTEALPSAGSAIADAKARLAASSERLVLDTGRDTLIGNVQRDRKAKGWARIPEPGACSFCLMLATRGAVYRSEKTADFKSHDNCVPGWTVVNGPSVEVGYRRWYEGKLVILRVAGGQELAITPNHPVLTDRGWVPAGLLSETDKVAQRAGADLTALDVPHEHDVPARIQDVWRAHGVNGLTAVPVAPEDFHGDGVGSEGDVNVVWADRYLARVVDTALAQQMAQAIGAGTRSAAVAAGFAGLGDLCPVLSALALPANSRMGSGGNPAALLARHLAHAKRVGSRPVSNLHVRGDEPTPYGPSRHSESFSDGLLRASGDVGGHRFWVPRLRRASGPGTRYDPTAEQGDSQRLSIHAEFGRALLERLSGGIQLSRLIDLRRVDYAGHVFNLQTTEGWYDANSLVVSNCRCHVEPVFTAYEPPARVREAEALWVSSTRGKSGNAARIAFRQAVEGRKAPQK